MAAVTNDFNVWQESTPVIMVGISAEFDVWQLDCPVVDVDESNPNTTDKRRRAAIY
jgi:hypothetical protein